MTDPFYHCYYDDSKKNRLNNSNNGGHGLKALV